MTLAALQSLHQTGTFELIHFTREGIPASILPELASAMSVDRKAIARILHISERTLSRRLRAGSKLTAEESDRAIRLARLVVFADQMIGNHSKAALWLQTPNHALKGSRPFDLLDTEAGIDAVRNVLGRIAYGVYS